MRRIQVYDMLEQAWKDVWQLSGPGDIEWLQLKSLGIDELFEMATQPQYSEFSELAARIMMSEYPKNQKTSELIQLISKDPVRCGLIAFAQSRVFLPILEQIAFTSVDALPEARSFAIDVLIWCHFDFTPHKQILQKYLSSENRMLQIPASAALALIGSPEGEKLLADALPQTKFLGEVLHYIETIYLRGKYRNRFFPICIENSLLNCLEEFLRDESRYDLHFIHNVLEIIMSKSLRRRAYSSVKAFLQRISWNGRYRGLFVALRSYMLDQPYETPDGKRWKSVRKPHPSNRAFMNIIEESLHKMV